MLEIKKLNVKVKDKEILKDFDIDIKPGEIHGIMGPNGTGKSTLSKVILGSKDYEIVSGDIIFNGVIMNDMTTDERARLGIFLSMQSPVSIEGVSNSEFLKTAVNANRETPIGLYEFIKKVETSASELSMSKDMIHRSINEGASGGERKKNEILQAKLLEPKLIILDEIDSGLDVDSLRIVCTNINKYLETHKDTSILMITHYTRIFEYITPDYVHMMVGGRIVKTGDKNFAFDIEKNGYTELNGISEN